MKPLYWLEGAETCTSWENGVTVRGNGHDAETLLLPEANPISHMDRSDLDLLTVLERFSSCGATISSSSFLFVSTVSPWPSSQYSLGRYKPCSFTGGFCAHSARRVPPR